MTPLAAVRALKPHRANGIKRDAGEEYFLDRGEARHLAQFKLVELLPEPVSPFERPAGRMLRTEQLPARETQEVVACLNIWNDLAALRRTMPTWYDHVDTVIAVDGAYVSTGRPGPSTDGTVEFLKSQSKVILIESPAGGWPDQNAKRNAYLELACSADALDDLLFVVDADEFVTGAEQLRAAADFEVGWVRIESPLYKRPYGQPRLFRARPDLQYRGRHHWVYRGDELLATHQYGGLADHAAVPLTIRNARGLGHDNDRANAKRLHAMVQTTMEAPLASSVAGADNDRKDTAREALRIAQVAKYDAGLAVSRFHTALNATTPHSSVYFSNREGRPYGAPGQHDLEDAYLMDSTIAEADVLHCHLTLGSARLEQLAAAKMLVLHHHGSMLRQAPDFHRAMADHHRALVLVSTLELLQYAPNATWLPNPIPVARYTRIRNAQFVGSRTFRVAHSPSKRHLKGTDVFLAVCEKLRAGGLPIEPVLIEGMAHGEGLARKATCDAAFDAFFIGIQCSGLEAAAMGMPVIAGDAFAAERYRDLVGEVPYTYANDAEQLEHQLVRLVRDEEFRMAEAYRVRGYVESFHDEAAVALRYLDLLDESFGWRQRLALKKPDPQHIDKPAPETPAKAPVTVPAKPEPKKPRRRPTRTA